MATLAIDGGTPVRNKPWPARGLFGEEEKAAAVRLFDQAIETGNAIAYGGPEEAAYQEGFAAYLGGGRAHTVNSGTSAVFAALAGLGLEPYSEVIVPPITDPGGVMPTVYLNLVPVVADAAPGSYNMGPEQVAAAITERTRAVLVAHIAGEPVDMAPMMALAKKHGLLVVEDCAQAHGATYRGEVVGTLGDIAAFSTMSGKHHATGAQGGVIFTRNEDLFWRARRFADRGKPVNSDATSNIMTGLNLNLNELSAAIGRVQLTKLPGIVERRQALGDAVKAQLAEVTGVSVGWQVADSRSSYWFLRIHVDPTAIKVPMGDIVAAVRAEGLPVGWPYAWLTSQTEWWRNQQTFGTSGYPWQAPEYQGDRHPDPALPNATASRNEHFNVAIHESCGATEAADIVAALSKVAAAYAV